MEPDSRGGGPIRIWDLPVRLFHWALVLVLALSWTTAELDMMDWHMRLGYAALGLVLFRVVWGLVGSDTARFAHFVKGPGAALAHVRDLFRRGPLHPTMGHNALGGWSVVALLAAVLVQAASGLFTDDGILYAGPLADRVDGDTAKILRRVHFISFDVLRILVVLHVAAILFYWFAKGENLVGAMVTGRRRLGEATPATAPRFAPAWCAVGAAAVAIVVVLALVRYG